MVIAEENIQEMAKGFPETFNSTSAYFSYLWAEFNNISSLLELGIISCIVLLSYAIQKWIQKRYENYYAHIEEPVWYKKILYESLTISTPLITFLICTCSMSISAGFTSHLEIYKFAIKLTLIWFLWVLIARFISDVFMKSIVGCTLIPLLIFSSLGLSTPVINYLDSLGFSLAGLHLSVFLVLKTLLLGTCLVWIARLISKKVIALINEQNTIDIEIRDLMENLFQVILYGAVMLITVDLVGIDLKSLALVSGAIGIGIGLGLQKIAANFISGIIILFEQNIKVGHLVEVAGGGNPGWIRHLGTRAAVVDTGDGRELLIPNEELLTKTVIDWTAKDKRIRTDLRIKVTYKSDLEKAKQIMLNTVLTHPICSKIFPPSCFLEKFTDNGAEFLLQFWVEDLAVEKMNMQNDILFTIWKKFTETDIEFASPPPFPRITS